MMLEDITNESKALLVERQMWLEKRQREIIEVADAMNVEALSEEIRMLRLAAELLGQVRDRLASYTPRRFRGMAYPLNDKKEDW